MSEFAQQLRAIEGNFEDRHFLSMHQLSADDISYLIAEAELAEAAVNGPERGISLLSHGFVQKAVMRQPSTRTGGSMQTAMLKLGGSGDVISGMDSSAEGKGETQMDSAIAFATQADIIATRTAEEFGPHQAAQAIDRYCNGGKLKRFVPVINLGDGRNEHPTQAMGDLYTMYKHFEGFAGLTLAIVGDHERYRAHHSLLIGAATVGMNVIAVESKVARVPDEYARLFDDRLHRTDDLDAALQEADALYMGRNPDEYDGDKEDLEEMARALQLASDYETWVVNFARLQQMQANGAVMHPRPRRAELDPDLDFDSRAKDIEQMANMIPMRMAIIAAVLGRSIQKHAAYFSS